MYPDHLAVFGLTAERFLVHFDAETDGHFEAETFVTGALTH